MRLKPTKRRDAERGAAAVEFAIASMFLIPLLLGMLDVGTYFYIGLNVTEAQHLALATAASQTVTDCSASATNAQKTAKNNAASLGAAAVTTYLTNNGVFSLLTLSGATPSCSNTPINPTWTMTLVADYKAPFGKVMPWDKASPTSGYLRYTAKTLAMRGK
jgi:Flp pilus assembly protein TadG